MGGPLTALSVTAALGCALNAGVFFAFSSFVMQGLGRLRPADGAAAMRSINVTAVTPAFMTALFGTAALCVAVVAAGLGGLGESYGGYLVAGGALYLAGPVAADDCLPRAAQRRACGGGPGCARTGVGRLHARVDEVESPARGRGARRGGADRRRHRRRLIPMR